MNTTRSSIESHKAVDINKLQEAMPRNMDGLCALAIHGLDNGISLNTMKPSYTTHDAWLKACAIAKKAKKNDDARLVRIKELLKNTILLANRDPLELGENDEPTEEVPEDRMVELEVSKISKRLMGMLGATSTDALSGLLEELHALRGKANPKEIRGIIDRLEADLLEVIEMIEGDAPKKKPVYAKKSTDPEEEDTIDLDTEETDGRITFDDLLEGLGTNDPTKVAAMRRAIHEIGLDID